VKGRVPKDWRRRVSFEAGELLEQRFENQPRFESGQRCADADVRSMAERQRSARAAIELERVGVFELRGVAIR
jgi:hypothetical protein